MLTANTEKTISIAAMLKFLKNIGC